MDETLKQRLIDWHIKISFKTMLKDQDLSETFSLYNAITGENRKITTCSSCVSSVVSRLKREYRNLKL